MSKIKICLDAGHVGKANRSPANKAYYESDMAWKLHLLVKKELEGYGFEVIKTRTSQNENLDLEARGEKAKGCDLFLSYHSNAVGSYVNETTDYPLACCCVNGKADTIGLKLAECVGAVMGTKQKARIFHKKYSAVSAKDWYGVLRGAVSVGVPAVLLEHSFHTNTKSTNWLLNDSNLEKLAKEEAKVIAAYYGVEKPAATSSASAIKENDVVTIADNAVYYTGGNVPAWVKAKRWIVDSVSGDRAVINKSEDSKNAINSPINVKYLTTATSAPAKDASYLVKVTADALNIRAGAGTNYAVKACIKDKKSYTIVEEKAGIGSVKGWGKLKSGAGWISLDYAEKV